MPTFLRERLWKLRKGLECCARPSHPSRQSPDFPRGSRRPSSSRQATHVFIPFVAVRDTLPLPRQSLATSDEQPALRSYPTAEDFPETIPGPAAPNSCLTAFRDPMLEPVFPRGQFKGSSNNCNTNFSPQIFSF